MVKVEMTNYLAAKAMINLMAEVGMTSYLEKKEMITLMAVVDEIYYRGMMVAISIISTRPTAILTTPLLTATVKASSLLMANPCLATSLILKRG